MDTGTLMGCQLLTGAEFYVAVDNAGLWPNLTLTGNGEILAAAYDFPGHGVGNGNISVWASVDGGRLWEHRGVATEHEAGDDAARYNQACGVNARGEFVVLAGHWSRNIRVPGPVQVCVSSDGARTWQRHELEGTRDVGVIHPYGPIVQCDGDRLACAIHNDTEHCSYLYWSDDHGHTWNERNRSVVAEGVSETSVLQCGNGKWLAVARRTYKEGHPEFRYRDEAILFSSEDDGRTWTYQDVVTHRRQAPAHLLRLQTGDILMAATSRTDGLYGVILRTSSDDGATWSAPRPLLCMPTIADCGYPSSVQLEDGTIVTAYYFGRKRPARTMDDIPGGLPWHCRHHMGVARYRLDDLV